MTKLVVFKPRKSLASASRNVRMAVKDIQLEGATAIGIEILKIGEIYYTVKDASESEMYRATVDTDNATERYTAKEVMELIKS